MMQKLLFRNVEQQDIQDIKKLIYMTWEWPKQLKNQVILDAALGIYANHVLNQSSFAKAAILDGKMVGVIFCASKEEKPIYRMIQDDGSEYTLALLGASESERLDICHALRTLSQTFEKHLEGREYDGTITFLAISPEAQGLKLGRKLWDTAAEYFKTHNVKSMYLFTDTTCNYGFYEHLGMSRRREQNAEFFLNGKELKITSFLYEYNFS